MREKLAAHVRVVRESLAPVHRDAWLPVAVLVAIAVLLAFVWQPLMWLTLLLAGAVAAFFRDPDRVTPTRDGLVVAPADGICFLVDDAVPPEELEMGRGFRPRIAIFLSVLDVHINRAPIDGRVSHLAYRSGTFANAGLPEAEGNERMAVRLAIDGGRDLAVVQIAGWLARRIVCNLTEGQRVLAGDRYGLIRFGSRVDVYLPVGTEPLALVGQRMVGGETVLADLSVAADLR